MGKKREANQIQKEDGNSAAVFGASTSNFDPSLASLFASSSGPVKSFRRVSDLHDVKQSNVSPGEPPDLVTSPESDSSESASEDSDAELLTGYHEPISEPPRKKRKVKSSDDLEARYLSRLAREEAREAESQAAQHHPPSLGEEEDVLEEEEHSFDDTPQHETMVDYDALGDREVAKRTVFLGNVSIAAIKSKSAKKTLLSHLSSFFGDLPSGDLNHKILSLRFRSTAYSDAGLPKKAAFAKKELMEGTTKNTNAYAVYSTEIAARKAARLLNGTVVLGRHLRVDHVAHPAKIDHKRCVFVGNLDFVDEETIVSAEDGEQVRQKKKTKPAGDVEEGLWQTFAKAGTIESVRVVRDKVTRVGKGFAYVQFVDENAVETALLYNDKKYPPLLPRKLRVVRAKKFNKSVRKANAATRERQGKKRPRPNAIRNAADKATSIPKTNMDGIKKPETFIFEGYRASSKNKASASQKTGKKPDNRGSRRAAAFRATGGKRRRPT